MDKIKALFFAASPVVSSGLMVEEEIRAITKRIRATDYRDSIELVSALATRPDDLIETLNQHKPQIVHFSAHGKPTGEILLLDKVGCLPKVVKSHAIRELFKTMKDNIRVVLLNACYSKAQALAIVKVIDCAIGIKTPITNQAAIAFASSFYGALGFGRSVKEAYEQGRAAILLEGIDKKNIPELLVKEGVDPSRIFLSGQKKGTGKNVTCRSSNINELDRPYKFLDYYETSDVDSFWGREKNISEVAGRVKSQPFLILYGISGVGKTSLLLAGVIPYIEKDNFWCIYARCEDDPVWSIKRKVIKNWPSIMPALQPFLHESLPQFFARVCSFLKKKTVILLDQFEEFFRLSQADRNTFGETLAHWYTLNPPSFQLVLSIREEYLGKLDELNDYIPNPLAATYPLRNLTKQNAKIAILKPAESFGITYSEGMVDQLIDELADKSKVESGIFPSHLQIVCSRLAESIDKTSRTITCIDVQKYGGVTGILDQYIDQALSTLPQDQQELSWNILKRATTAARTKFILKADEICQVEGSHELLAKLVERRLIRKIKEKEDDFYELAHDKLAETLNQRMSEAEKTARDLIDMVRLEYTNWLRHTVPMDEKKIRLLKKHSDNPHLRLPKELEEFVRWSERKIKWTTRKQRILWIIATVVVITLFVIVYNYFPRLTTPKPNLERIRVESGWFEMGSNTNSPFSRPKHDVYVESFEISKFEVTNGQYAAFVRAMRWDSPKSEYFSNPKYANHPVVGVNWKDALAFCRWLGGRLPTEAEWEKASTWDSKEKRKLAWPWGDKWDPQKLVSVEGGLKDTAPVYFLPEGRSPYGAMHMVGNVAEWTSSIYKPYPYNPKDGRERIDEIASRVIRGGSWAQVDVAALPTNRSEFHPSSRDNDLGFRVAWSIEVSSIDPKQEK